MKHAMEYRIILMLADQHEVVTCYKASQQAMAFAHMAAYAAEGKSFRCEFC